MLLVPPALFAPLTLFSFVSVFAGFFCRGRCDICCVSSTVLISFMLIEG